MTDDQAKIFGALSRGRLIFPFHDELAGLREADKNGGLTERESKRRSVLEHVRDVVEKMSGEFHSALLGGDIESASSIVRKAVVFADKASVAEDDGA